MADKPDYYALLGVTRGDSELAIRAAYRRLVSVHHPDRHPGDPGAVLRLTNLVEAYEVLGDPDARRRYDDGFVVQQNAPESNSLEEVLGRVVDAFVSTHDARDVDGRDRQYRLSISFESAARGTQEQLELPFSQRCSRCEGRGFPLEVLPLVCEQCQGAGAQELRRNLRRVIEACEGCAGLGYSVSSPCEDCAGRGRVQVRRHVDIHVPAGVSSGDKLIVRGAGEEGEGGGASGDCFVLVEVTPHACLERKGKDVVMTRPISLFQALRGGWISVPTVDGARRLQLPPASRDKAILRMVGLGVGGKSEERGDQLVHIEVEYPREVDAELRSQLQALDKEVGAGVFPKTRTFEASYGPFESESS